MRPGRPPALVSLACTGALAAGLFALAGWRALCVLSGPDIDTDAYAHHMIARAILADPRDLAVHWVWLPLFHYAQVPVVALGGTMETVRWANILLAAALPVFLFLYVRATSPRESAVPPDAVALLAAFFAGACPIAMQMGTTAQPEPAFALLVLAVAIAFEERRYLATSMSLGAAVLLRYEAWAALLAVAGVLAIEHWWPGLAMMHRLASPNEDGGSRGTANAKWKWLAVAFPAVLIFAWAALRRPVDGRWFGFLHDTKSFANDALHETRALDRGLVVRGRDVLYYPVFVASRVLGVVVLLVPFGVLRTLRCQGARFVLVLLACLAFVSFTWVMRSSLGLDRHFVCIVPLYATFAAQGVAAIADAGVHAPAAAGWVRRAVGVALGLAALAGLLLQLDVWMGQWRGSIARSLPDRRSVGAYLRSLPGAPTVFCDEATVEILSGLDRRRFDRHWLDDPHTWDLVRDDVLASGAPVYVATWKRKLRGHEGVGEIVFRATEALDPGAAAKDDDAGLVVMRVAPPSDAARP